MARMKTPRRRSLLVIAALAATLLATAQPAAAAEDCTYSFQNNEAPDLKIKKVIDGKEVTQTLLTSGRTESITVTSDDTVVVRRPSDRARLFRASNCERAGTIVNIGELPAEIDVSCTVTQASPGSNKITVRSFFSEAPAGSYYAIKAYNPVDDEDYEFLGSFRTQGQLDISRDSEIMQDGDWELTSRIRLADGSKLPRVSCGTITVGDDGGGADFPAGVIGNRDATDLATSCWAVDRTLADGSTISDVSILNAGDPRVVYARTETRFLGRIDENGEDYDPRIALVKVRGGDRQDTYDCTRGWTGDVSILTPDGDGVFAVDIDVMAAVAGNGGTQVLWRQGQAGPAIGNAGGFVWSYWLTNTRTNDSMRVQLDGESVVQADLVNCAETHVAVTSFFFGDTSVEVVNLGTGAITRLPGFQDNSTDYGFDCNGRFWYLTANGPTSISLG